MSFKMTWHVHAATMQTARRRVMVPTETLPQPLGDKGIPSLKDRAIRAAAHRRLQTALQRLGSGDEMEEAA